MTNPFNPIVVYEDYKEIIGIPKEQLNNIEIQNRINKWLVQATEQFDSMISGSGELGRLYRWFKELEDNQEDNYKKYKIKKAICSWVETFVIKGKFWVDGVPAINSNVNIEINASSDDSNVESKRKDIIQDLVALGLYRTTNFGNGNINQEQEFKKQLEELALLTKEELNNNYLKIKPQRPLQGPIDFANNDLTNGGNISGNISHAKNYIRNYEIIESTINLDKNQFIGKFPNAINSDYILDPITNVYKMINQFDAHYFGTLTTQEIYNAIYASGMEWRPDILYKVKYITQRINNKGQLFFFEALQENIDKDPLLPENSIYWRKLAHQDIDINLIIEQIRPQLHQIMNEELNKLPHLNFILEAQGQEIEFPNEESYNQFKQQYNIDDTWFEDTQTTKEYVSYFEENSVFEIPNRVVRPNGQIAFGYSLLELVSEDIMSFVIEIKYNTVLQTIEIPITQSFRNSIALNDFIFYATRTIYTPNLKINNCLIQMRPQGGPVSQNIILAFDNDTEFTIDLKVFTRKIKTKERD